MLQLFSRAFIPPWSLTNEAGILSDQTFITVKQRTGTLVFLSRRLAININCNSLFLHGFYSKNGAKQCSHSVQLVYLTLYRVRMQSFHKLTHPMFG